MLPSDFADRFHDSRFALYRFKGSFLMSPIRKRITPIIITMAMLLLPGMPIAVDLAASDLEGGSWIARQKISKASPGVTATWKRSKSFSENSTDVRTAPLPKHSEISGNT